MQSPRHRITVPRIWQIACAMILTTGCESATVPDEQPDLATGVTREVVAGVTLALTAAPSTVGPGDTVHFTATARNATAVRLQVGVQCGPAMDVAIVAPGGQRRSALADATGGGHFTCELGPHHFVEPASTLAVRIAWVAPTTRGTYVAQAGLRRSDGLGNLSAPLSLQIR